jgi:DNA-binding response OmpR family regulator
VARIAVVEDDVQVRLTIARILEKGGHEPILVEPGQGVLAELQRLDFDVLTTDICMAWVDGWQVLKWMRANRPRTPVLAVSGGSRFMDPVVALHLAQGLGANILPKPFRAGALLGEIAALIGTGLPQADVSLDSVTVDRSPGITVTAVPATASHPVMAQPRPMGIEP